MHMFLFWKLLFTPAWEVSSEHLQAASVCSTSEDTTSSFPQMLSFFYLFKIFILSGHKYHPFTFPPSSSRTGLGLPESEACFLQGAGQRRLRGLAVEEEGRQGLLLTEMEEVLVCVEGQLPVLVHKWGGRPHASVVPGVWSVIRDNYQISYVVSVCQSFSTSSRKNILSENI